METIMPIASAPTPPRISSLPQVRAVLLTSAKSCGPSSSSSSFSSSLVWGRGVSKTTPLSWSRKHSSSFSPPSVIRCGGTVREINESEFPDVVLKSQRPVLVEFVATWCGPCRLIAPAVQALAQEYEDKLMIVKIDHDSNPKLIEKYKVYGLPTLIVFQNGEEVPESRREGAITKVKLKEYVDKFLQSLSTV